MSRKKKHKKKAKKRKNRKNNSKRKKSKGAKEVNMATLLELHSISQSSGELFARFEAGMLYKSWEIVGEDPGTTNHANRIELAKNTLLNLSPVAKQYFKYFLSDETIQTNIESSTDGEIMTAITNFYNTMANTEVA